MRLLGPPLCAARSLAEGVVPPQQTLSEASSASTGASRSTGRFYDIQAGVPTISLSLRWILCFFEYTVFTLMPRRSATCSGLRPSW